MEAFLKPRTPREVELEVVLIARTGNRRIKIRGPKGQTFAVDTFRLSPRSDRRLRFTQAQLDTLPWQGAGVDPLTRPRATDAPPWSRLDDVGDAGEGIPS